ncbi:MAG TPA: LLM class flavin-dependent oxidoreductase [Mycobacteriales bacterium]|nr:LLM class flavin-dependent oxidoreductase [Mycobacteriales bacterium]
MIALGAVFRPQQPPERLPAVARAADAAGLDQLWLWEDCFREGGISTSAAALAVTERLRVGIGLLPVPLRNVALTAMEIASLERLSGGRFVPVVGHGVLEWMGQIGARVDSPVTLLREYVLALRSLLRGERVSAEGRYVRLDGVALDWPPADTPPVLVGAVGPRTLRLSGEIADGTLMVSTTRPAQVREARRLIDEGRARAGRTDRHELVVYLHATTGGPDATARMQAELRRWDADPVPEYEHGVDAASIAAAVHSLVEAGADTVVLEPTEDEPDPEAFVRFAAEEVRPRL